MNEDFERSWDYAAPAVHGDSAGAVQGVAGLKQIVTIRLDADMLGWFKAQGPGYQTRINRLLREHMQAQLKQAGQGD